MGLRIDELTSHHHVDGFDCGVHKPNYYLVKNARQHAGKGISRTYVLVDEEHPAIILGFYTICVASTNLEKGKLPSRLAKILPDHDLPVVRLGRLAIATSNQHQGLGTMLVTDALRHCVAIHGISGIVGFVVDSKPDAIGFYQRLGFIEINSETYQWFLPIQTIQKMWAAALSEQE